MYFFSDKMIILRGNCQSYLIIEPLVWEFQLVWRKIGDNVDKLIWTWIMWGLNLSPQKYLETKLVTNHKCCKTLKGFLIVSCIPNPVSKKRNIYHSSMKSHYSKFSKVVKYGIFPNVGYWKNNGDKNQELIKYDLWKNPPV